MLVRPNKFDLHLFRLKVLVSKSTSLTVSQFTTIEDSLGVITADPSYTAYTDRDFSAKVSSTASMNLVKILGWKN